MAARSMWRSATPSASSKACRELGLQAGLAINPEIPPRPPSRSWNLPTSCCV